MGTEQAHALEIDGVNLKNYIPYEHNFDTTLYVHKKVLKKKEGNQETNAKTNKKKKDKISRDTTNSKAGNGTVLEQTVRFAKQLVPIAIPPCESNTPVFYTIETCSKCRQKDKRHRRVQTEDDTTYEKKSKEITDTYRKERKRAKIHDSVTESVLTHSNQSTLNDLNINQSLSCTMSEQSDKREKYIKNEVNSRRKRNKETFIVSESFEAVATELTEADDTRIKVQLMNSAEKNAFCDSIRSPVLNAVRDCISDINIDVSDAVKAVQRTVKCNTEKLDTILDRLARIEKLLETTKSPRKTVRASTLEQLGEDVEDNDKSDGEEYESHLKRHDTMKYDDNGVDLGCGEVVNVRASTSVGVKTDRPNRIPARFCWTDATNKD